MTAIWEMFLGAASIMGPAWAALVLIGAGLIGLAGVMALWLLVWR